MTPDEVCRAIRHMPVGFRDIANAQTKEARRYWVLMQMGPKAILVAQIATLELVLIQEGALEVEGWRA